MYNPKTALYGEQIYLYTKNYIIWFTDDFRLTLISSKRNPSSKCKKQYPHCKSQVACKSEKTRPVYPTMYLYVKAAALTSMTSSAGRMPMFDNVLKKASLFWGCNVCENAQNSFRKFTYKA